MFIPESVPAQHCQLIIIISANQFPFVDLIEGILRKLSSRNQHPYRCGTKSPPDHRPKEIGFVQPVESAQIVKRIEHRLETHIRVAPCSPLSNALAANGKGRHQRHDRNPVRLFQRNCSGKSLLPGHGLLNHFTPHR
ncbi:MAG: hypothetical protein CL941_07810 [Desulfobacter sp.]|nr:hypothetical protein [Desulfobacter sp.]